MVLVADLLRVTHTRSVAAARDDKADNVLAAPLTAGDDRSRALGGVGVGDALAVRLPEANLRNQFWGQRR